MSSLRICLVTQRLGIVQTGPDLYAQNLLNRLINDGHEVTVISQRNQADFERSYHHVGVESNLFANNQARWIGLSIAFNQALKKLEQERPFDLIHFTDARDSFLCKTRSPMIANLNDAYSAELLPLSDYREHYRDWFVRWIYYCFVNWAEKVALPKLDLIITNSIYTNNQIKKAYPQIANKLCLVYKSIDVSHYEPVFRFRQNHGFIGSKTVLLVGSNLQRKGIEIVINASPEIIKAIPDIRFRIIGNDNTIPKIRNECKQLGIDEHFEFTGQMARDQLMKAFSDGGILILPSLTEAFGVVLLEAMASGLPVIGTNVGGIPEIIENGNNGLLIPPNDPDALCNSIINLINDPNIQNRFAIEGLATARKFDIEIMMAKTYAIYDRVIESRRNGDNEVDRP